MEFVVLNYLLFFVDRNPELRFQQALNLDKLMEDAYAMYCKDNSIAPTKDITPLFSLGYSETTGYLARAAVNTVLQGGACMQLLEQENQEIQDDICKIS